MSNRDDSNRDDKRYAKSNLLCFLEAIFLNVYLIILWHIILYRFWIFIYFKHIHVIEIGVTGMADCLFDSLHTLVNRIIYSASMKSYQYQSFDISENI